MWKQYFNTNYSISDMGEVRNDKTNKLLSQSIQQGYHHVTLNINGQQKRKRVHRLVAETFLDNPDNKPYVNHIDGNRENNCVNNLEWVTPTENTQHAVMAGLFKNTNKKAVNQYNLDGKLIFTYASITEASENTGTPAEKITMCCKRQRKTANDYQWRYVNDVQDIEVVQKLFITGKQVGQYDNKDNLIAVYPSFKEAARAVNGTSSAISRICSGINVHHKGYKWKIVEEIVQDID